jgi:predicted CopG family antitoxin
MSTSTADLTLDVEVETQGNDFSEVLSALREKRKQDVRKLMEENKTLSTSPYHRHRKSREQRLSLEELRTALFVE